MFTSKYCKIKKKKFARFYTVCGFRFGRHYGFVYILKTSYILTRLLGGSVILRTGSVVKIIIFSMLIA